jgi:hypothetical protein
MTRSSRGGLFPALALALMAVGCDRGDRAADDALADSLEAALEGRAAGGGSTPASAPPADTTAAPADTGGAPARVECAAPEPPQAPGARTVQVFLSCGEAIAPVQRQVAASPAVLRAALEELLRGPTPDEARAGFHSFFSTETAGMLESVVVGADGVARISFRDFSALIPNASSSAGSQQLLDQLRATIFQFPSVREANLSFGGDCEAFWNWLQRGCEPLRPEPR